MELLKDLTSSLFWATALSLMLYLANSIAIGFLAKKSILSRHVGFGLNLSQLQPARYAPGEEAFHGRELWGSSQPGEEHYHGCSRVDRRREQTAGADGARDDIRRFFDSFTTRPSIPSTILRVRSTSRPRSYSFCGTSSDGAGSISPCRSEMSVSSTSHGRVSMKSWNSSPMLS
jgi:hypothetical protein